MLVYTTLELHFRMLAFSESEPSTCTCIIVFFMTCIAVLVFVVMKPLELLNRAFSRYVIAAMPVDMDGK